MKYPVNTFVRVKEPQDSEMDMRFLGLEGKVIGHNANGATGNTEDYPLHEVEFNIKGCGYPQKESFWYSELERISTKPKTKQIYHHEKITDTDPVRDAPITFGDSDESTIPGNEETRSGRNLDNPLPEICEDDNLQRTDPPESDESI